MLDELEEEVINQIRDIIGEHFNNFGFCVVTESGDLFYDYRDRFVGKALFLASAEDMDSDIVDGWLDFNDEDDDSEGEDWKDTM